MKENTLPFGSEAHLLVLVRQLCNCAKLGKDYQPKAKGEVVTSSAVQKALPTRDSESKVFKFELGEDLPAVVLTIDYSQKCIDVSRYNKDFGTDCSSRAQTNSVQEMVSLDANPIEYFPDMPYDGVITRKETSK